jgi:hypothetical protein
MKKKMGMKYPLKGMDLDKYEQTLVEELKRKKWTNDREEWNEQWKHSEEYK